MLKYLLSQLTQMSFWFGILVVVLALIAPTRDLVILGFIMIFMHDDAIKAFIAKHAPGLTAWIQKVIDEIES